MSASEPLAVAFGCMVRFVDTIEPYREFILNAREHGHEVSLLVLAVSRTADLAVVAELHEMVEVALVEVGEDDELPAELVARGAAPEDVALVLDWEVLLDYGLVPYDVPRNAVVLRALLSGADVLVFFDHATRPLELVGAPNVPEGFGFRKVDFVGAHLGGLAGGAALTTGAYSGYDAFPPITLRSLRDLLHGLGREEAHDAIVKQGAHAGLHLAPETCLKPRPAFQAWAGNLALDLRRARSIPAFFSGCYHLGEQIVLARGEDTLLGAAAVEAGIGCVDVGTRLFVDPHDTFPERPALESARMKERLYWNCLGWVARLPLLDWMRREAGLLDWSLDDLRASRRLALQTGTEELADVLEDYRFLDLPTFFDLVFMRFERTVETYGAVQRAWRRIVEAIGEDGGPARSA